MLDTITRAAARILTPAPPAAKPPALTWPTGWQPTAAHIPTGGNLPFPTADVVVITWTDAEAKALADLTTPGTDYREWAHYEKDWPEFETQLTGKSPAKLVKAAARYATCTIAGQSVLLVKSDLHLSTDSTSLPLLKLWQNLATESNARLIITTGTAGGIKPLELGDVLVTNSAKFNCTKRFKSEPWAQTHYAGTAALPGTDVCKQINQAIAPVFEQLKPSGVASRAPKVWVGADVETVDYFAFADDTDSYGVVKDDPHAYVEEMDDATLPLALAGIRDSDPDHFGVAPAWLSIRNASDPQVPHMASKAIESKWAAGIYQRFGYYTSLCSVVATIGVIATSQASNG